MKAKLERVKNGMKKYIPMIWKFALNDLKKRFSGSLLGFLWAYIQPLVAILVFWFIFQVGLKNAPVDNVPFIAWLVPPYVAWSFISDSINQSTNVLYEYSYLVKKIKFKIEILPLVKVASSLIVHAFFIVFAVVVYLCYGYKPNVTWLQLIYYCFAATVLLTGVSWLLSSLSVFWKDVAQIVNVLLQIGFWFCPIFWDPAKQNATIGKILKLNPFYYITMGYRECFIGNIGFFEHPWQSIYFWCFTLIICCLGLLSFKRLSKHYADLL